MVPTGARRYSARLGGLALVVGIAALGGCPGAHTVECDFGVECPVGSVCDPLHATCVTPVQLQACVGQGEGETCVFLGSGSARYRCFDAVCLPVWDCGDDVKQAEELCDGADLGGLGCGDLGFAGGTLACRDDCAFDRSGCTGGCGNGVVEEGEACDDADDPDASALDGCVACAITECLVAEQTNNFETTGHVAMGPFGEVVTVWSSLSDGNQGGITARVIGADGAPASSPIQVNATTELQQVRPSVAVGSDGRFVIVWQSNNQLGEDDYGIVARRFAPDGTPDGSELPINSYTAGSQMEPTVAMGDDGRFVVVWASASGDGDGYSIIARLFDAAGEPLDDDRFVNSYTAGAQSMPHAAMAPDGRHVVVWASAGQDGHGLGVYGQRFTAGGAFDGPEFQVNTATDGDQGLPWVGMDSSGAFVVTWTGYDPGTYGVFLQRFDPVGLPRGGEQQVNTIAAADQWTSSLAVADDGRFVVVWQSWDQDGWEDGIFARRYDAGGDPLGPEFQVNTWAQGNQVAARIGMAGDGRFAVTWFGQQPETTDYALYLQRYTAAGEPLGALPWP